MKMSTKHSIFTLLTLHHVVIAFQQPHQRYEHRQNSLACTTDDNVYANIQKHENCDLLDRRIFAKNTILTSLALVSIIPDNALAATDIASAPAATTPSVLEGELSVSPPPPNRAVVTDDGKPIAKPATKVKKNKSDPRFFIAGGASAAISHGITTPIDVVKTRMQSDTSLSDLSPSDAALRIVEAEGPKALTAGLGPTVIGVSLLYFTSLVIVIHIILFLIPVNLIDPLIIPITATVWR